MLKHYWNVEVKITMTFKEWRAPRNCVSMPHLAAATCHYCTITVCTTIVFYRAQASRYIPKNHRFYSITQFSLALPSCFTTYQRC